MHTNKHQLSSSACCGLSSTLCLPHEPLPRPQISCSTSEIHRRGSEEAPTAVPKDTFISGRCRPCLSLLCGRPSPAELVQCWWSISPRACAIPLVNSPNASLQSVLWVFLLFFTSVVPALQMKTSWYVRCMKRLDFSQTILLFGKGFLIISEKNQQTNPKKIFACSLLVSCLLCLVVQSQTVLHVCTQLLWAWLK